MSGGGAVELKESIEADKEPLSSQVQSIGFMAIASEDDAFIVPRSWANRMSIPRKTFATGDDVRDWSITSKEVAAFPYADDSKLSPLVLDQGTPLYHHFWVYRTRLKNRLMFDKTPEAHGMKWYEFMHLSEERYLVSSLLVFACVATHNHFASRRDRFLLNRHAPVGTASIKVDDLNSFLNEKRRNMRCHYAVELGNQRIETEDGKKWIKGIRQNFNSPFRPFVLATTSIGQEGLDFHTYCRKIVHWNLPSNPIDLEQREGRINRFKGLVIRQQIAAKYGGHLTQESCVDGGVWEALFKVAEQHERLGTGKCELIPFWHVEADRFQIERIIPLYPFSRDRARLSTLLKTLALYRLAFGQPRQAELVEHLLTNISEDQISEIRDKLMIDLSPINFSGTPDEKAV